MIKPDFTFENLDGVEYKVYLRKKAYVTRKIKGKILKSEVLGWCEDPKSKNPKIVISEQGKKKVLMATIIEEFLHAFYFDKKEKEVRPLAAKLAKYLYLKFVKKE